MKLLARLITKEWLKSFFSSFSSLFLVVTIAHLLNGLLRDSVSFRSVFFNYLIEIPGSLSKILPVCCLLASLFSIAKLKNRNELTALFASGYPLRSYILNIIFVSSLVGGFLFYSVMYVQPLLKQNKRRLVSDPEKFKNLSSKGLKSSTIGSGKIWFKGDDYFFSFSSFDKKALSLANVTIYKFNEMRLLKQVLHSPIVFYNKKSNRWESNSSEELSNLDQVGFPKFSILDSFPFNINESGSDLKQIESDVTSLNLNDLISYILKLHEAKINTNEYEIIIYEAFAAGFSCIIFALLALQSLFTPNRRTANFGTTLGYVFVFTLIYWLINSYFIELGINSKVNALAAAFMAPLSIGIYVIYNLIQKTKTISR